MSDEVPVYEDDDDDVRAPAQAPAPLPRAPKAPRPAPAAATTSVVRAMNEAEDQGVADWLDSLAADAAIKIRITRKRPRVGPNGENLTGILDTVDGKVDEDYIREIYGGGSYQLVVMKPSKTGSYSFFRSRSVEIAGEPKLPASSASLAAASSGGGGSSGGDDAAERAMTMLERSAERAEQRANRLEQESRRNNGMDAQMLDTMTAPYREQVRLLADELRAMRDRPNSDPLRDRLMERMMTDGSGALETLRATYEARIDRIRDAHESEVKQLRAFHADDLKRKEAAHEHEVERLERQHERMLTMTDQATGGRVDTQRISYESRIESMKAENGRLERDIAALQARIGMLEAKKDQSLQDKAEELLKVREALEGLGGAKEEADQAWYEKVLSVAGNSEALMALVGKIGAPGAANPAPAPGLPPGGQIRTPDGQMWIVGPDGQPQPMRPRGLLAARKRRQAPRPDAVADGLADPADASGVELEPAPAQASPVAAQPAVRPPDASDVRAAVAFMENAVRNNTDAVEFANSARHLVPADVLRFIQRVGIDEFLNHVVEPGSALTTQRGRNFARTVARVLLEGAPGAMPAPALPNDLAAPPGAGA